MSCRVESSRATCAVEKRHKKYNYNYDRVNYEGKMVNEEVPLNAILLSLGSQILGN